MHKLGLTRGMLPVRSKLYARPFPLNWGTAVCLFFDRFISGLRSWLYVRGSAFLVLHRGSEAAAEFQKILDHRGIVLNEPIGALAHLGLARSYAMQGDTTKAKAAYQDFLALWKDSDPDIPILIAAKSEYAKLK
jgi:hypothetical protein